MTMIPLTLFVDAFFCSPFDYRCFVALEEKRLDYAVSRVMYHEGQGLSEIYKDKSITARVPGLAHGDFWIAESLAIVEYLEEAFPSPAYPRLHPVDLHRRGRARQVMAFLGNDLFAMIRERPSWSIAYPREMQPLSPPARREADELLALATHLVAEGFLAEWSLASADLTFALLRLARGGETLAPELQGVVDANLARPSVHHYLSHERPPNPPLTGRRTAV